VLTIRAVLLGFAANRFFTSSTEIRPAEHPIPTNDEDDDSDDGDSKTMMMMILMSDDDSDDDDNKMLMIGDDSWC